MLFDIFAVLKYNDLSHQKKLLPVWYGGGIGNNCNAHYGVGHLNYAGFIFPKNNDYEYKHALKEAEARLIDFFNKSVDPKSIAKTIRRLNYVLALGMMRECETL